MAWGGINHPRAIARVPLLSGRNGAPPSTIVSTKANDAVVHAAARNHGDSGIFISPARIFAWLASSTVEDFRSFFFSSVFPNSKSIQSTDAVARLNNPPSNQSPTDNTTAPARQTVFEQSKVRSSKSTAGSRTLASTSRALSRGGGKRRVGCLKLKPI